MAIAQFDDVEGKAPSGMTTKRILLIIPELGMGGAQRSLAKLSFELSRIHWVGLVVFQNKENIPYEFGGELINLDVESGKSVFQKFKAFVERVVRLRRIKKQLGVDLAISFLEGADYINVLSRYQEKVVLSIRGSKRFDENMFSHWYGLRRRILIPFLYQRADCIVTVNEGIKSEMEDLFDISPQRVVTIGNFYDGELIRGLSMNPRKDGSDQVYRFPVMVTTGRLAPEKGLLSVVDVFAVCKRRNPDLRWVIVGDGPGYRLIQEKCKRLNLSVGENAFGTVPDVLMVGAPNNVFSYLHGASVYVMNSSSEGFPNGLAEAMICGVPIISADCPYGPREIMAPGFGYDHAVNEPFETACGILMPVLTADQIEVWADRIVRLVEDQSIMKRQSAAGKQRMLDFEKTVILPLWFRLLDKLLAEKINP